MKIIVVILNARKRKGKNRNQFPSQVIRDGDNDPMSMQEMNTSACVREKQKCSKFLIKSADVLSK